MKNTSSKTEIIIAGAMPVVIGGATLTAENHAQVGKELTRLYREAQAAELAIVRFGAAFWAVESELTRRRGDAENETVATRGHGGKFGDKGSGFKGWLEEYAPEISRTTARRYRDIAAALIEKFQIENPVEFFSAAPEALPASAQKKREEVIEFIASKSVRAIQMELGLIENSASSASPRDSEKVPANIDPETGKRKFYPSQKSAAELANEAQERQRQNWREAFHALGFEAEQGSFGLLEDEEAEQYLGLLKDLREKLLNEVILPRRRAAEAEKRTARKGAAALV